MISRRGGTIAKEYMPLKEHFIALWSFKYTAVETLQMTLNQRQNYYDPHIPDELVRLLNQGQLMSPWQKQELHQRFTVTQATQGSSLQEEN